MPFGLGFNCCCNTGRCPNPVSLQVTASRCSYGGQNPDNVTVTVTGPKGYSTTVTLTWQGSNKYNTVTIPIQDQGSYTLVFTSPTTFQHTETFTLGTGCNGGTVSGTLVSTIVKAWLAGCYYTPLPRVVGGTITVAYSGGASGSAVTGSDGFAYITLSGPEPQPSETIRVTGSAAYYYAAYNPNVGQSSQPAYGTYGFNQNGLCEFYITMNPVECYACYLGNNSGSNQLGYFPIGLGYQNDWGCSNPQPRTGTLHTPFGSVCLPGNVDSNSTDSIVFVGFASANGFHYTTSANGTDITCSQPVQPIQVPVYAQLATCSAPVQPGSDQSYYYACVRIIVPMYSRCDPNNGNDKCAYPADGFQNFRTAYAMSFQHNANACNPATMVGDDSIFADNCAHDPNSNYPPAVTTGSYLGFLKGQYAYELNNCGCNSYGGSSYGSTSSTNSYGGQGNTVSTQSLPKINRVLPQPQKHQVVVARHNENIRWVNDCPHPVIVYNKGNSIDYLDDDISLIHLPNRGREAGTILQHIVSNYNQLADWTYFVQGNTHSGVELFGRITTEYEDTTGLTREYKPDFPEQWVKDKDRIEWHGKYEVRYGNAHYSGSRTFERNKVWLERVWSTWFEGAQPKDWVFCYGAELAVPKYRIHGRPLEFWQYALNKVNTANDNPLWWDTDYFNGWACEILWKYFFGDPGKYRVKGVNSGMAKGCLSCGGNKQLIRKANSR